MANMSSTTNDTTTSDTGPVANNALIFMYSLILVLSLLGNVFVIAVVCGNKKLRTVFNSFIVNMAISDLFIPLLALPLKLVELATRKDGLWLIHGGFGNATCKIFIFLIDISPAVTVFSLVIIAVNRFIAIVRPMSHSELFSFKRCKILIAMTWISVTVIFSPYFHITRTTFAGYNMCDNSEWIEPFDGYNSHKIFQYFLVTVFFVAPFASIIFLYSIIIYKLHADSKTVVQMLDSEEARKRKVRNKHIFFLSLAMIMAFAVFWGPFFIFLLLSLITEKIFPYEAFLTVQFLGYTNSAVNPLIYFIFLGKFRSGLKRLLCRCLDNDPNGASTVCNTRSVLLTKENGIEEKIKLKNVGNSANKKVCLETSKGECSTAPKKDGSATSGEGCSSKL